jgi:cytochrome c-type protein NapC
MQLINGGLIAFILVTVALAALIAWRPSLTTARGGKILAFIALFIFPVLATAVGTQTHLEHAKSTQFCLSCHVMEPYGKSLRIDSKDHVPANHYQNTRISRDDACYTCHTTYTMFGDISAKLKGMQHVWVYYLGTMPEKIELYEPYENRECLHCHEGARTFEENEFHVEYRGELASGETTCLECHEKMHEVDQLASLPEWEEKP